MTIKPAQRGLFVIVADMNEREQAAFNEIADRESLLLDEVSLLEHASQDVDLCQALRARQESQQDVVRRMYRAASGDWSIEQYHDTRVEIALDAVILRFQLTPAQASLVLRLATESFLS